jgi:hypothetical protein
VVGFFSELFGQHLKLEQLGRLIEAAVVAGEDNCLFGI